MDSILKRLLPIALLLSCAVPAFGQAVLLHSAKTNGTSGGGASVTLTITSSTAGSLLVAYAINTQSNAAAPVISDATTGNWPTAFSSATCHTQQFNTEGCAVAYICGNAGGITAVKSTGAGFAAITLFVSEYSGVATSSCLDQQAILSSASNTSSSITTTVSDLIWAVGAAAHTTTFSAGTCNGAGCTDFSAQLDTNGASVDGAVEDNKNSAAGAQTASFGGFTNTGGVGITAFKLSGGATVTPKMSLLGVGP